MAADDRTSGAGAADRTLADLARVGQRLTAAQCLVLLDELVNRYDEEFLATAGPDTVVVTGRWPTVRAGGACDPGGAVHALAVVAWFALTGTVPGEHAVLRRHTVVEVAGPQLGPVLAAAVDPTPLQRCDLPWLAEQLLAARAGGRDASEGPPVPGRHRRRAEPRTERRRGGDRSGRRAAGQTARSVATRWRTAGHRRVLVAAAVAAAATLVVGWLGRDPSAAGAAATSSTVTALPGPVAPTLVPAEVTLDPVVALARLIDARADALVMADSNALSAIEVPESSLWRADRDVIDALAAAGARYAGLSFTVQQAALNSRSAVTAVVCARVGRSAYTVVGPAGDTRHPADSGRPLCYQLAGQGTGWRLTGVLDRADSAAGG